MPLIAEQSFAKIDDELDKQMARMKLRGGRELSTCQGADEQQLTRAHCEQHAKFYTQLFEALRRRKQVPTQALNLDKMRVLEKADNIVTTTPVVPLTDEASLLNLKTQSSPSIVQQSYQPQMQAQSQMQMQPQQKQTIQFVQPESVTQSRDKTPPTLTQAQAKQQVEFPICLQKEA